MEKVVFFSQAHTDLVKKGTTIENSALTITLRIGLINVVLDANVFLFQHSFGKLPNAW